jgi:hypothetical protein
MAQLNKQVLGRLKGSVGDIVFRQRNGKNYAAIKPGSFMPGNDPAAWDRRNKFTLACKFSSSINAVPYLNDIWRKKVPSGTSPFNYITKTNYKYADPDELTDLAVITPDFGFGITINSSSLNPPNLNVSVDPIGSIAGIDPVVETAIRLCTIISLTNPNDEFIDKFEFITLVSEGQATVLDSQLTFQVPYSNQEIQVFNSYMDKKAFSVLITLDADENPVHYSSTILL